MRAEEILDTPLLLSLGWEERLVGGEDYVTLRRGEVMSNMKTLEEVLAFLEQKVDELCKKLHCSTGIPSLML